MSSPQEFSDELVEEFTLSPEEGYGGMIQGLPKPKPSTISRTSSDSSLGQLDILPAEILAEVLKLVDFQSLVRLLQTSLRGKEVVEASRFYRDLMRYCPEILTALAKTRLLQHHSSSLVRQVLSEQKCASCFGFGGFLFLLTCERTCCECLSKNHAFHPTTVPFAMKWFALTREQLRRIPVMQSIPRNYPFFHPFKRFLSPQLISVKHLLQLAIDVHGSRENVAKLMPTWGPGMSRDVFKALGESHKAPLKPLGHDLSEPPSNRQVYDIYHGMGSIRMPFLTSSGLEHGRQCRGCHQILHKHYARMLPDHVLAELVPGNMSPGTVFNSMVTRLRARREFVDHLGECHGVRSLLGSKEEVEEW